MATSRAYVHGTDCERMSDLLIRMVERDRDYRGWVQPRWVYAIYHPMLDLATLGKIRLWEEAGDLVAAVHHEDRVGVNHIELDPRCASLRSELMESLDAAMAGDFRAGRAVHVYIDDADLELQRIAASMGYRRMSEHGEPDARLAIPARFPRIRLPRGFRLQSLADDFDVGRVHRVMHRGFNHAGEPPQDELEARRRKLLAPGLRRDLTVVAVAPSGDYAAFCGVWPVPRTDLCYVEPVATDPEFRRMGLGTAVVLEAVRRCAREGARTAQVGSDQPFYCSIGFERFRNRSLWRRVLAPSPSKE